jgi:hypothetical protein
VAAGPVFGVKAGAVVGDPRLSSGGVTFGVGPAAAGPRPGAGGTPLFPGIGKALPLGDSRSSAGALSAGWPARMAGVGGVWLLGTGGGAPFAPGTGKAFALGGWLTGGATAPGVGWPGFPATAGAFAGCGALIGVVGPLGPGNLTPGAAGEDTMAGLTDALGGRGAFPCWIRFARVAAAAGNAGPTTAVPDRPPGLVSPGGAPRGRSATFGAAGLRAPGAGRALMTLLITVVL